ncbi:YjdF family protein [Brevibacillus panacihumi]|uniref:DUF2992 family protein n=1 Tax=Brevibacillus panacihumi TaxID=497735 RepID=A0A3M8C013_9BACL|nr:YjdF family protein [Brevibacillus panacihumi]RNB68245.1 DUF2992 family protein [Brevibacillus panacihumi]
MKLTVYFDGQFWVGVVEVQDGDRVKAGRFVFGSEPKDQEVLSFILNELDAVISRMSQEVIGITLTERKINPKRVARQAAREMSKKGISSFAQEALKMEYEKRKKEKQGAARQQREDRKERQREIRIQKAKAKRRGK